MKIKLLLLTIVTLYSLSAKAQYTKMHDFGSAPSGKYPHGALYSDGTFLYGMTNEGGSNANCENGCGTIFKIKPDGTGYVKLHDFNGINGAKPSGSLISDSIFLYGMASEVGASACGSLFKIKPDGTNYTEFFSFNGLNGLHPGGSLMFDGTYLFGTTNLGGQNNYGTLFKIKTDGTGYVKLIDFAGYSNGKYPSKSLITDGTYLYGMTNSGGANNYGTFFKIKPDGTGYVNLFDFTGTNGANPWGALISDGNFFYGMTERGGASSNCQYGCGTIFKIKADGTGYVKLLDFTGGNGQYPTCSLILDGLFLYGMIREGGANSYGTIFKIKSDGTGYSNLHEFSGTNGQYPMGSLISDGAFVYGMANRGGANSMGVIFKLGLTTAINENNSERDLIIYPNPTSGQFQISSGESSITDLQVYNVLGEMVYEKSPELKGASKISVSLPESLRNGIYFAQLKTEQGTAKKMIMLSR